MLISSPEREGVRVEDSFPYNEALIRGKMRIAQKGLLARGYSNTAEPWENDRYS